MITIEYIGEYENVGGSGCSACSKGAILAKRKTTDWKGKKWAVGEPQKVSLDEVDKYLASGLFKLV